MTNNKGPDEFRKSLPEQMLILKHRKPIPEPDLIKWATYFESCHRRVRRTYLPNDTFVSTIFLGLDHQYGQGHLFCSKP